MWNMVWAVIRREYLQRVRSKWFIASTLGAPLFMAALIFLPAYLARRGEEAERSLALVDRTGVLQERLATRLDEAGYRVRREAWSDQIVATLSQEVKDGDLGGFIVLDDATLRAGEAVLYGASRPSTLRRVTLRGAITQVALESQLQAQGVDVAALLGGGELRVELLAGDAAGMDEPQGVLAFVGAFLLYLVILLYAASVMRATLEEKTSRVVEIVISSMKPWQLMLGKILGVGSVGLTQMAVWVASAAVLAFTALPAIMAARPELSGLQSVAAALPSPGQLVLLLAFFLFGYFLFSGMYAAVGAMCSSEEEAQQAQFPVTMLVIIPAVMVGPVIQQPNSLLAVSMSLVPFFSPVLMWSRAATGAAPLWQIGLSFALMAVAILAVAWVAGRIYRVGILMAGKRPTVPELWRWVREA
jgi:ABC-2 type transport system permease protein